MLSPEHRELIDSLVVLYQAGEKPERDNIKTAVKVILADLAEREPGRSVEVRIPPFAAIQVVAGHTHRRGTPAAVVEADPQTLILLAAGVTEWAAAVASGALRASGERSDLSRLFPLN